MKMNLKKLLSEKNIFLDLKSRTKEGIIREMIDLLCAAGLIKDRDGALEAVLTREKKMSTGMQNGIAIPHGKTDSVDRLIPALAVKKKGVDFKSLDGKPACIIIMTVSPASTTGPHIQFLAEISGLLKDPEKREKIIHAKTPDEIREVFD
jgi:fructose-specific phosphotransferase system IIA component